MALREFRDRAGHEWKAWDIRPESMHPVTAREMFVGRYVDFQEGWLVFESAHERRRLAPYPSLWAEFSVEDLEQLLAMAQPSPNRLARESSGSFPRVEEKRALAAETETPTPAPSAALAERSPAAGAAASNASREFVGPSGRRWSVAMTTPRPPGERALLRFAADDGTVCDLDTWPDDWTRFTTAQLIDLLRHAEPSRDDALAGDTPRRRREDRQP
ncbi:MAG TPA: hypothetical protein VFJ74_01855 [Gemmatimonadaceae bacterium]|nr:hypothetical protein [Gemmatimonadaceae bacterium]